MAYLGHKPAVGENNSFRILDDISSFVLTFDGSSASAVGLSDETITITENNHRFITGQRVTYSNGGGGNITGLTNGQAYFVINHSKTQIKLASSASNALAGTAVNLTGLGTGSSHTLTLAFDGVNTKFDPTFGNGMHDTLIKRAAQLVISINGVIQQPHDTATPTTGFGVDSLGHIIFSTAPASTDIFWGHILATNTVTFDSSDNDVDTFTGNGSTTSFTLSKTPPDNRNILVTIDGVVQYPSDAANTRSYNVSENVMTFVAAPGLGTVIQVRHIGYAGIGAGGGGGVTGFYGRTGNVSLQSTDNIVANDATFSGNVSIAQTLTYEDVTDIDAVGLITARSGIKDQTLTAGHVVFAGTGGRLTGEANLFYNSSNDRLGIGTNVPASNLQVDGTALSLINKVNVSNTLIKVENTSTGNAGVNIKNADGEFTFLANKRLRVQDEGNGGIERVSLHQSGNVGIGTTNPNYKLQVHDSASPLRLLSGVEGNYDLRFVYQNSEANIWSYASRDATLGVRYNYKFHLMTNGSKRLTVHGDSVGIGTQNPDTLLEIGNAIGTGTANLLKLTSYTNSQSSRPGIVFWNNNPNTAQAQISAKGGASYNASKLHFSVANSSRVLQDRACIDEFGTFIIGPGETRRNTKGSNQHQVLLIEGTGNNSTRMSMIRNTNDDNGPEIQLIKTRGTSVGSVTKPNQNDYIGSLVFIGGDDTDLYSRGAEISVQATGTPANDRIPSDIIFSTTPTSGATAPQEAVRITSEGKIGIGGETSPDWKATFYDADYTGVTIKSNRNTATDNIGGLHFKTRTTNVAYIQSLVDGTIKFRNSSSLTERLRLKSDGKLFLHGTGATGTNNSTTRLPNGYTFNIAGNSSEDGISIVRYNSGYGAYGLNIGRSRSNTVGTNLAVVDGNELGHITFYGANGSSFSYAAQITAIVDGEVGTGGDTTDMPGALSFRTTADGSGGTTPTERIRITSGGQVNIGGRYDETSNILSVTDTYKGFPTDSLIPQANFVLKLNDSNNRWIGIGASSTAGWIQASGPGSSGPTASLAINPAGGYVSIGTNVQDGLLTIGGNSDATSIPSIRLLDGSDTREVSISNQSGDLIMSTHGTDNAAHGEIKIFDSGLIHLNTDGANTRLAITTAGRVGINQSSPDAASLHIGNSNASTGSNVALQVGTITGQNRYLTINHFGGQQNFYQLKMRVNDNQLIPMLDMGNPYGSQNHGTKIKFSGYNDSEVGAIESVNTAANSTSSVDMVLRTGSGPKEVLRLQSGGDARFYNGLTIAKVDADYSGFDKAGFVLSTPAYNEYHFTWSGQSSYTISFTCGSYFHSEFVYVQHQTNGGHHMHHYVRGKWANNHYTHTGFIYEHSGNGGACSTAIECSDQSGGGTVDMKGGLTEAGSAGASYRARYGGGHEGSSTTANGRLRFTETYGPAGSSVATRSVILKIYYGSLTGASIS